MLPTKSKQLISSLGRTTILTKYFRSSSCQSSNNNDISKTNSLITNLIKYGKIREARKVFDEMPQRDVMTWMNMINGYVKSGMIDEARKVFDSVDAKKDVVTWTLMINGYVKSKRIEEAERLFFEMPEKKNTMTWNTMIEGYAKKGLVDSAMDLFIKMPEKNIVSWNLILSGLSRVGRVDEARRLFDEMPEKNVISWTTMLSGLARNGLVEEARRLFDTMPEKNDVSWNAMIDGFVRNNELNRASKVFDEMPKRDSEAWTAVITRYAKRGQNEEALKVFSKMTLQNLKPDEETFASVLRACGNLAGVVEGRQVHQTIVKMIHHRSLIVSSSLINMYSKCGELRDAEKVFDELSSSETDLIVYNSMISAYARHGRGNNAITTFDRLRSHGLEPNNATYVAILSACSHSGLVSEGLRYFDDLVRDETVRVNEKHYSCYVDLCGRAGKLRQALDLVERLEIEPSLAVLGALLLACNVYDDAYVRSVVARRIVHFRGNDKANAYALLSSVYASSGDWKKVAETRRDMKELGLKKQPGCSWIRIGNAVRVFVASDNVSRSEAICSLLCDLHEMMRVGVMSNFDDMSY